MSRKLVVWACSALVVAASCGGTDAGTSRADRDPGRPASGGSEHGQAVGGTRPKGATGSAGSGGGSAPTVRLTDAELISASADRVSQQRSMRMAMVVKTPVGSAAIDGAFDGVGTDSPEAWMRMDLSQLSPEARDAPLEMRFVDGGVFISASAAQLPPGGPKLPAGVRWLSLDPQQFGGKLEKAAGGSLTASGSVGDAASTFTDSLGMLRGVSDRIERLGTEPVRGVDTVRYRARIDPDKAVDALPPDDRAQARAGFDAMGWPVMPIDVWIDGDGLTRRMQLVVEGWQAEGVDVKGRATVTMEFFDFGAEVKVERPPASQTADLLELMMQSMGTLSA